MVTLKRKMELQRKPHNMPARGTEIRRAGDGQGLSLCRSATGSDRQSKSAEAPMNTIVLSYNSLHKFQMNPNSNVEASQSIDSKYKPRVARRMPTNHTL